MPEIVAYSIKNSYSPTRLNSYECFNIEPSIILSTFSLFMALCLVSPAKVQTFAQYMPCIAHKRKFASYNCYLCSGRRQMVYSYSLLLVMYIFQTVCKAYINRELHTKSIVIWIGVACVNTLHQYAATPARQCVFDVLHTTDRCFAYFGDNKTFLHVGISTQFARFA